MVGSIISALEHGLLRTRQNYTRIQLEARSFILLVPIPNHHLRSPLCDVFTSQNHFPQHVLLFTFLILLQCNTTGGFPLGPSLYAGTHVEAVHKRATPADQDYNTENVYGRGVLIGSYCQAVAFLLGFLTLRNVDPKSQFAGIVLAFQLLYRWWTRLLAHSITIPELWIGLAQLLLFTTPGAMLVFLSFSYTRRHWKTTDGKELLRKEVIRGEGLNFLLVFTFLAWVNATNFTFAFTFIFKLAPEAFLTSNPVWMWITCQAESEFFKACVLRATRAIRD